MLYCDCSKYATVAQQVEQLTRNEQVARSNRVSSSKPRCIRIGVFTFASLFFGGTFSFVPIGGYAGSFAVGLWGLHGMEISSLSIASC